MEEEEKEQEAGDDVDGRSRIELGSSRVESSRVEWSGVASS